MSALVTGSRRASLGAWLSRAYATRRSCVRLCGLEWLGSLPMLRSRFDTFFGPLTFDSDETIIVSEMNDLPNGHTVQVRGNLSRVTGFLSAEKKSYETKPPYRTQYWDEYFLKCRPAQRMF